MDFFVDIFEKETGAEIEKEVNLKAVIEAIVNFIKDLLKFEFGVEF